MLAGHLVTIASTIRNEYSNFNIINLITEAIGASANRSTNPTGYNSFVKKVRGVSEQIRRDTAMRIYPLELQRYLLESEVSAYLPENIAAMLIAGFPDNKEFATSSGELGMYKEGAQKLVAALNALISIARQLHVEVYDVPDGMVGLDVLVPRALVANGMRAFADNIDDVGEWIQMINEFATGRRDDPEIIYISTTDPILSLSLIPATVYGALLLYKLLLEIAEKHLNIRKSIRDLKKPGLPPVDLKAFEEQAQEMIKASVEAAVKDVVKQIKSEIEESRRNEIQSALARKSIVIMDQISNGMRLNVSIESHDRMNMLSDMGGIEVDELADRIEEKKAVEARLTQVLASLDDVPLLTVRAE